MLLGATSPRCVWANSPWSDSYESVWTTQLSIRLGDRGIATRPARVGQPGADDVLLPRRRARGQARARPRRAARAPAPRDPGASPRSAAWPAPSRSTSRINAGGAGAHGWGAAMSTDTAFALGVARAGRARRRRACACFLLTLAVVDDLVALRRDRDRLHRARRAHAAADRGRRCSRAWSLLRYAPFGLARAGRGRARGVGDLGRAATSRASTRSSPASRSGSSTSAYPPARDDLERGRPSCARSFREQPTPELARSAQLGVASAISPNERLQYRAAPVDELRDRAAVRARQRRRPHRRRPALATRSRSPITLGILVGYVVGKPLGHPRRVWLGDPPLRSACGCRSAGRSLAGGGVGRRHRLHGLAADRRAIAFDGRAARGGEDRRARRGGRSRRCSAWVVFRVIAPPARRACARARSRHGRRPIIDLADDVDPERDHIRGADGRAGDARRVRRLRVPVLRPGRGGRPRAARVLRRRPALRLAPPAAQRRPPARPARRRGGRGRGRAGRVLGDARHAARPPGRRSTRATCAATPRSSGSTSTASRRTCDRDVRAAASPRTSRAPTRAASPARRRSSSTAAATRAPTTSTTLTAAVRRAHNQARIRAAA